MVTAAIETDGLTRVFGQTMALDGLSLRIEEGEIFGFLGPNGAGKSTTIRILLDLIRPTAGAARVLGFDCQRETLEVRRRVGYLPGDLRLYGGLTGRKTVELFASLRGGMDEAFVRELAGEMGLDLEKRASAYSKGNRQKLGVLLALLGRPPVLLLDEPTSGLDPLVQRTVWGVLRREAERGATVFFSSHVMSEVEQTCERVGILRAGKLVAVEPVVAMKARARRNIEVDFVGDAPPPDAVRVAGSREVRRERGSIEFELTGEIDALLKALAGYQVADLRTEQPTLDEILLSYYREEVAG